MPDFYVYVPRHYSKWQASNLRFYPATFIFVQIPGSQRETIFGDAATWQTNGVSYWHRGLLTH
jgi:hypothetical protein